LSFRFSLNVSLTLNNLPLCSASPNTAPPVAVIWSLFLGIPSNTEEEKTTILFLKSHEINVNFMWIELTRNKDQITATGGAVLGEAEQSGRLFNVKETLRENRKDNQEWTI
jgi:hypothetical protein